MAIRQQGDQQAFDQRGLADDGLRQVVAQARERLVQAGMRVAGWHGVAGGDGIHGYSRNRREGGF